MFAITFATKGLKLGDTTPDRKIECESCNETFEFNTVSMVWEDDDTFEFCDVVCDECERGFQICALSDGHEYEFFTTSL